MLGKACFMYGMCYFSELTKHYVYTLCLWFLVPLVRRGKVWHDRTASTHVSHSLILHLYSNNYFIPCHTLIGL